MHQWYKELWRIQDFTDVGARQPPRWDHQPIIWSIFFQKMHENFKKLDLEGCASLAPPWIRQWGVTQNVWFGSDGYIPCPAPFTHIGCLSGCYHFVLEEAKWGKAEKACQALNPQAHLVSLESMKVSVDITSFTMHFTYMGAWWIVGVNKDWRAPTRPYMVIQGGCVWKWGISVGSS